MFRSIASLALALFISACGNGQPLIFNQSASTDSYTNRITFIGSVTQYRQQRRIIFNDHVACPPGYEPVAAIQQEVIDQEWFREKESVAEFRQSIADLYPTWTDEYTDRIWQLENFVLKDPEEKFIRVRVVSRSCRRL